MTYSEAAKILAIKINMNNIKNKKIYWKTALSLIKSRSNIRQELIDFNEEKIPISAVVFFNQNGIKVPSDLINYNQENDPNKMPEIIETLNKREVENICTVEFALKQEIEDWIKQSNINLSELTSDLVTNFYQTTKNIQKRTFFNPQNLEP